MRRPATRWIVLGVATVIVLAAAALAGFATGGSGSGGVAVVASGRPAPAWSGTTLGGRSLSLADERGHWLVLNFFATWCHPCQEETPQLADLEASGRARVVGVVFEDSVGDARAFVAAHHVTWPLIGDPSGDISERYRVVGLPVSYVIDPAGREVRQVLGGVRADAIEALISPARPAP